MKIAIIVFPGSNCDQDVFRAVASVKGLKPVFIWHKDTSLQHANAVIIPGGFSYGDYLRCGAMARFSPIMNEVITQAARGLPVLGICNGFQILTESGLLPGVLIRNRSLQFICDWVHLKLENATLPFTKTGTAGTIYRMPIAHAEGNYFAAPDIIRELEDNNQIVVRYTDAQGRVNDQANPNGSTSAIAGVCNRAGNVVGLMPHPDRCFSEWLGSTDGRFMFESLLA